MNFFPSQMNNHGGEFPFTFFGFNPETTKEEVLEALKKFPKGDNKILSLAMAYKLDPDNRMGCTTGSYAGTGKPLYL